jgi:hypothetical protein
MLLRSVRSETALAPTFLWGGDFEKNPVEGVSSQAHSIATGRDNPQRASGASPQLLSFGGKDAE